MDKQILDATEYPKYKALEHKVVAVLYVMESAKKDKLLLLKYKKVCI